MARKKEKAKLPESSWLDTYADTITLLMTFFVLLYSMSSVDAKKFESIASALNSVLTGQSADSILQYDVYQGNAPIIGQEANSGENNSEGKDQDDVNKGNGNSDSETTYDQVSKFVQANDLSSLVSIKSDDRGVIIQIKDSILFEVGQAELKQDSAGMLDKINALISTLPNNIIVEGHTDSTPINTSQYPSNWELSGARAARVVRFFVDEKGQNSSRFKAQGLADTEPIAANDSDEHKALNRRVNILIVANNEE